MKDQLGGGIPAFVEAHFFGGDPAFKNLAPSANEALGMKRISLVIPPVLTIAGIVLASNC